MIYRKLFALLLTLILTNSCFAAEFNFSVYIPNTLAQVQSDYDGVVKDLDKSKSLYIAILEKRKIEIIYTGEFSDIESTRTDFIKKFDAYANLDPTHVNLYKQVLKVNDSGKVYYFPVQEQLIPYMTRELTVGQKINVYVLFAGSDPSGLVLLISEFKGS